MTQKLDTMADMVTKNIIEMADHEDNPENMICQIIVDMEDTFSLARRNASESIDSKKKLERELKQAKKDIARWTDCAERCLKNGDSDMARRALVQKKESEIMAASLKGRLRNVADESQELNLEILRMGKELENIRQKALELGICQKVA